MEKTILSVADLHVSYGNIRALNGISLEVQEGKIVTIIGANGAGKSTTLMAISGLVRSSKGEILYKEIPVHNMKDYKISRLGIIQVPEGRSIFNTMTVMENLEMGAYSKNNKNNFNKNLETVFKYFPKLKDRINQISGTLSGGEQQMLAIGRGMMAGPELLLLDEPSLGLAPIIVEEIFKIIIRLNKAGVSMLLVEQNAKLALEISDNGYVIENGRIIMQGKSSELAGNSEVIKAYLGG